MARFPYKAAMQLSLLCASFTLCSAQPVSQGAQFLKRMKEYWKEGDLETAKRQIRSYLEKDSTGDLQEEMHLLLGDIYLKEGNYLSALEEYNLLQKEDLQEKIFYNKTLCFYETDQTQELVQIAETFPSHSSLSLEQKNSIRYLCASNFFENAMKAADKDLVLLEKSKELFTSCAGTSFEPLSLYPLARIHEITGQNILAASYYEAASKCHPDADAHFLFQAALLRSEEAPELAITTFKKLFPASSKQSEALYNCLLLQYKTKQLKEFISTYETHHHILNKEQEIAANYLLGKSLFHLEEFEKAIDPLLETMGSSSSPSSKRTAQLMLLECAYKIQNIDLYQKIFRNGSAPLVNDENYTTAHLVYIKLLKEREHYGEFIEEAQAFMAQNPEHPEQEQVLWDTAYFLYQSKKWKQADALFASLITTHPGSKFIPNAWRLSLNCALSQMQSSSLEEQTSYRTALIDKIKIILLQNEALTSAEKETFSFELIKNLFLQERFEEVLSTSQELLKQIPQTRFLEDLKLLQTLCFLSDPKHVELFIEHAEALLEQSTAFAQRDQLRLHLFNAYVQKADLSSDKDKDNALAKAAYHLYELFEKNPLSLKKENIQWLAEYHYDIVKNLQTDPSASRDFFTSHLHRSASLFEALLPAENTDLTEVSETFLFRLSTLLSLSGQFDKKAAILERFIKPQISMQSLIQRQLALELAEAHHILGNFLQALDSYNLLIQNYPSSSIRALAILKRSKLLTYYLPEDQKTEENPTYAQNLNDLKDLEIQRSLLSEPLHLEAGLEYIRWKSDLTQEDSARKKKQIHLLQLFKENFQSEFLTENKDAADPSTKEKEMLLSSYLQFAEAEILRLEASLIEVPSEAQILIEKAHSNIELLLEQSTQLPESLKKRIELCQQEMGQTL